MAEPRRIPEPAPDPWVEAIAFAIREARRIRGERALDRAGRRAKLTVIAGGTTFAVVERESEGR